MLHKRVLCVLSFSREKNNLITGKSKIEEQLLGLRLGLGLGLFFVLYFSCCIFCVVFVCILYIASKVS